MTAEELNIAICKARGWTNLVECDDQGMRYWKGLTPGAMRDYPKEEIDNHVNGIKALGHLHKAEKELLTSDDQWETYQIGLYNLITKQPLDNYVHWSDRGAVNICHATSHQRAEALARTLGIWVDTIPHPTKENPTTGNVEARCHLPAPN